MLVVADLRVLILGLGNQDQGNDGIGGRLARSLIPSFPDAEVRLASDFASFGEILHDYDVIIVLKSFSYSGTVGQLTLGSPFALDDGWGKAPAQTDALASAISYARLMGHSLPRIEVVNVCVGSEEWPERGLSPPVATRYRGIVGQVRSLVTHIIREAAHPVDAFGP